MISPHLRDVEFVVGVDTHKASYTAMVVSRTGAELETLTGALRCLWPQEAAHLCGPRGPGDAALGRRGHRELRPRANDIPARARGGGRRDRPAGAARSSERRENGRTRCHKGSPRSPGPAPRRPAAATRGPGGPARPRPHPHHGRAREVRRDLSPQVADRDAPTALRDQLRHLSDVRLAPTCARLRTTAAQSPEHRATVAALRATARRILTLEAEAEDHASAIELLVQQLAPELVHEPGVGSLTAAELLIAWSHPGRVRSEAAFAQMAGVAPIPASSGQVTRYRLNRCGDRHVNCALHQIVLARLNHHAETKAYYQRRTAEGRTPKEIKRCLKRFVARRVFRLLEATAAA